MRSSFRHKLEVISLFTLAGALAIVAFARIHNSSLSATAVRITQRVQAHGEPEPYQAHVFIPVRFDKQDHALSCEVATLKMVLSHRGVDVEESELIALAGVDPAVHSYAGGIETWGDPSVGFVGDIDGRMMRDGYGIYWQPLERVGNLYRETRDFEGWDADDVIRELQNGNPLVIWGCLGTCETKTWRTPEGKEVTAVTYEHTFVVNGFNGYPDVTGFWLIDPIYGRKYMELSVFMTMWSKLGYSGLVVY
jgi:uncharacterized protein YvpB